MKTRESLINTQAKLLIHEIVDQKRNQKPDQHGSVNAIIADLVAAGLFVEGDTEENHGGVLVQPKQGSESHPIPELGGMDSGGEIERVPFEDEPASYSVYPRKNWEKYVKRSDKSGNDTWTDEADSKCDLFSEIMDKHGYELGDAGGHPLNCSYWSEDQQFIFCWWGNPHHI